MTTELFSGIFLAAVFLNFTLHVWLTLRHRRHVAAHRQAVPAEFADHVELAAHQKAADYTRAKTRLTLLDTLSGTVLLLALTFGGLLQTVANLCSQYFPDGGYVPGLALIGGVMLLYSLIDLPIDLYRTFVIEQQFGFNKLTWRLYFIDLLKQLVLAIVIGAPLLLAVLWLMNQMGSYWWLHVWLFWMSFNLLALLLYPTLIAPLFNKFEPLTDAALRERIEQLLTRCGFRSSGLFVMDGSRRSSHGNAYFTGFGSAKRIVFYDTLLARLTPTEIEAVLAHELGHYRHRHVWQRIVLLGLMSLAFFALLGLLIDQTWFYAGLGLAAPASPVLSTPGSTALALLLFFLALPSFTFPLAPLLSGLSRRHEYQADAYAAAQTAPGELINALVKLYRDNASTLTPDPLHSLFHDSHPPAALRVAHLKSSACA
jgi:STE24 endopeptidase